MSEAAVAELRGKLAKSEEARQKLRHSLGLLKEHAVNAQVAVEALKKTKAQLKEAEQAGEQARRQATQAQQALTEEQRRRLMAEQAAAAAKAAAAAAERQAQRAEAAASAAQSDAADVRRQLRQVQAQLARVQAACDSGAVAARQEAPAQQQQDVQSAAAAAALQEKVERLAAELDRWRAALGPLAALAGGSAHSGPSLAPPPAPAPAPARVASPQKQRRGRKPASAAAPGGAVERPTSPTGVQAAAAVAAAAPPQPPAEDARARAVRQVAARQAEAAAAAKRGPPAAAANVLAEALGSLEAGRPAKRAKQAAQQASQPQPAARPAVHALPAAPVAPAEPSLAVSASAPPGGHPHEHPAAADEAAQLLGSITAAASPGGPGISLEVVRRAAADLHFRLAEDRLPLLLLVRCFETAVLDGAASAPQGQLLQLPGDEDGQHQAGAAAAEASPDAWFGLGPLGPGSGGDSGEQQLRDTGHEQLRDPGEPPFAVVWCKREALAGRHLPWLLHCAAEIQRLHSARAAAAAALAAASEDSERPAGSGSGTGESFAAVLQQHMHREVLSWCLAAGSRAGSGGGVRHTETEACALAAVAAALCRMSGDVEAFWALLLDLLTCPAAPAAVLPPLAAAIDVWPAAVAAVGKCSNPEAARCDFRIPGSLDGSFHAALQWLCAHTEELAASKAEQQLGSTGSATAAGDAPPPLLLERQPTAAAVYLRRLGQRAWGWQQDEAGDASAADRLAAAAARWRGGGGSGGGSGAGITVPMPDNAKALQGILATAAGRAFPVAAKPETEAAAEARLGDVEEEEI